MVVIAHDVDPLELVLWLPALCRAKNVPYCIVKGKARLGMIVHQKTAAVLAITDVRKEDQATFDQLNKAFLEKFNNNTDSFRKWGRHKLGTKATAKVNKLERTFSLSSRVSHEDLTLCLGEKSKEMAALQSQ